MDVRSLLSNELPNFPIAPYMSFVISAIIPHLYSQHFLGIPKKVFIFLSFKVRAPAVSRGLHRKVNPVDTTLLLYQQFVVVLTAQVADVQQDSRIAQRLFDTQAMDVHRTARQVLLQFLLTLR